LAELNLAIWFFDISHSLGRRNHVQENFLAIMSYDHIWLIRELVVVELHLLLILIHKVVLKGCLVINARHGQASCNTKDNSLLEWIIVGSTFLISLLMESWVLNQEAQRFICAIPSCLLQVGLEVSYFLELVIS